MNKGTKYLTALSLFLGLVAVAISGQSRIAAGSTGQFPYRSPQFDRFVQESFREGKSGQTRDFYEWMNSAYKGSKYFVRENKHLEGFLRHKNRELAKVTDPAKKAAEEIQLAAWLHKMVKSTIPKFSLDRGFEFYNVVKYGERQCFLQSVLLSGMLQEAGVRSGVVMVYKNQVGDESNNGHAITLVRLANGQDVILDASEKEPFAKHMGLFVRSAGYKYVEPVYIGESAKIRYYKSSADGKRIDTNKIETMDIPFLRSQFWYYRGERTVGGLLSPHMTKEGLQTEERSLRNSVQACSSNPLSVYMLGRVYLSEGKADQAKVFFDKAHKLYVRFGWMPVDPKQYYERTNNQPHQVKN